MSSLYEQLAGLTPEQRAHLERRLAERGIDLTRGSEGIRPRRGDEPLPLSFAQARLWFVQQLDPNSAAYNAGSALRLHGSLDIGALRTALHAIVARHESLRTRFVAGEHGTPEQIIDPDAHIELPVNELPGGDSDEAALSEQVATLLREPFDLDGALLRFALIRIADDDHLLVVVAHHIICDRWSLMVFLRELTAGYRASLSGTTAELPDLPVQYADWAIWQRDRLQGERLEGLLEYWRERLEGPLPYVELPTDHALPAVASYRGAQHALRLDADVVKGLRELSGRHRVSLFTLLLAAFKVLLLRYSGSTDIIVGTEVANRDRTEATGLIGLLVNTLVLRSDLSGDPTFDALLGRVHDTVVGALKNQEPRA